MALTLCPNCRLPVNDAVTRCPQCAAAMPSSAAVSRRVPVAAAVALVATVAVLARRLA